MLILSSSDLSIYFIELCETENLNFAAYFMIDKHTYEQVHLKVEPKGFLYEFLNSGDPLYMSRLGYICPTNYD